MKYMMIPTDIEVESRDPETGRYMLYKSATT